MYAANRAIHRLKKSVHRNYMSKIALAVMPSIRPALHSSHLRAFSPCNFLPSATSAIPCSPFHLAVLALAIATLLAARPRLVPESQNPVRSSALPSAPHPSPDFTPARTCRRSGVAHACALAGDLDTIPSAHYRNSRVCYLIIPRTGRTATRRRSPVRRSKPQGAANPWHTA